jgi:hypothetical protein
MSRARSSKNNSPANLCGSDALVALSPHRRLADKSLESWIRDSACSIRKAKDAPKYKDYILPFIFTKRLCDVFDDELNRIAAEVGSRKKAFHSPRWIARRPVPGKAIVRCYLPSCRTMPRARSSQNSNSFASSGFEAKLLLAERLAASRPPLQTTPGA